MGAAETKQQGDSEAAREAARQADIAVQLQLARDQRQREFEAEEKERRKQRDAQWESARAEKARVDAQVEEYRRKREEREKEEHRARAKEHRSREEREEEEHRARLDKIAGLSSVENALILASAPRPLIEQASQVVIAGGGINAAGDAYDQFHTKALAKEMAKHDSKYEAFASSSLSEMRANPSIDKEVLKQAEEAVRKNFDELTAEEKPWRNAWKGKVSQAIAIFAPLKKKVIVISLKGGPECDWEKKQLDGTIAESFSACGKYKHIHVRDLQELREEVSRIQ